jgi:hypothetical protein
VEAVEEAAAEPAALVLAVEEEAELLLYIFMKLL